MTGSPGAALWTASAFLTGNARTCRRGKVWEACMRVAVIPNFKASGSGESLGGVCAALEKLGAEVLLPA